MFGRFFSLHSKKTLKPANNILKRATPYTSKLVADLYRMVDVASHNIEEANSIAKKAILSKVPIHEANNICNELIINEKSFRGLAQQMVQKQMLHTTPHVPWGPLLQKQGVVAAFRSIQSDQQYGKYGLPDSTFENGMPAAIFNTRSGAQELVPASIVSHAPNSEGESTLSIKGRYDMLGFVFGPNISTALNVGHVFDQRFTAPHFRYKNDRYIYLIALTEGYLVADAI